MQSDAFERQQIAPAREAERAPRGVLLVSFLDAVDRGGQINLLRVVDLLDRERFAPTVVVPGRGPLFAKLGQMGVPALNLRVPPALDSRIRDLFSLPQKRKLSRALAELRPAIIYVDAVEHVRPLREAIGDRARLVWHAQTAVPSRCDADALRCADVVVSVSPSVSHRLSLAGVKPRRIIEIPNSVDVDYFKPGNGEPLRRQGAVAKDEIVLLTVGAIEREKGTGDLLQAFASSRDKRTKLWIVGRGERALQAEYSGLCRMLGIESRVRWWGRTTDVRSFYRACDLFVFPSHAEGLPLAVLEAMATGCACIGSDVLGVRHLLEGGVGRSVPAADPMRLRAAIDDLVSSREERVRLGAAARARAVERFALPAFRAAFSALFEELSS